MCLFPTQGVTKKRRLAGVAWRMIEMDVLIIPAQVSLKFWFVPEVLSDTQISVDEVSYVISLLRMRNGAKCHYYRGRNGESIFIAKNEGRLMGHFLLTNPSRVRLGLARASTFFSGTKETTASNMDNRWIMVAPSFLNGCLSCVKLRPQP